MTRRDEIEIIFALSVVGLIATGLLMGGTHAGGFSAAIMLYGGPLLLFSIFVVASKKWDFRGLRVSTVAGFLTMAVFEAIWESNINELPNSMPGFVYLFFGAPLGFVGLIPAEHWAQRFRLTNRWTNLLGCFFSVFLTGSIPVLWSLAKAI